MHISYTFCLQLLVLLGCSFTSIAQNDKGVVNISGIEEELARVLQNHKLVGEVYPVLYGDDIYETSEVIVKKAIEYKLGARGLRSLCEAIFTDAMFEMPSNDETEFKVTKPYAENKLSHETIKKLKAVS